LDKLQDRYWNEFERNASWLDFSWHQIKPGSIINSTSDQIESYKREKKLIINKVSEDAWNSTTKLHRWMATLDRKRRIVVWA